MTNREFFASIVASEFLSDEIRAHAAHSLELLDAKSEAQEAQKAEKARLNAEVVNAIRAELADHTQHNPLTIGQMYDAFAGAWTRQKLQSVIRTYMTDVVGSTEVTVDKRVVKGYYLLDGNDK